MALVFNFTLAIRGNWLDCEYFLFNRRHAGIFIGLIVLETKIRTIGFVFHSRYPDKRIGGDASAAGFADKLIERALGDQKGNH